MTTRRAQHVRRELRKLRQQYESQADFHHAVTLRLQHTGMAIPGESTLDHFLRGRPTTTKRLGTYEFALTHWDGHGRARKKR